MEMRVCAFHGRIRAYELPLGGSSPGGVAAIKGENLCCCRPGAQEFVRQLVDGGSRRRPCAPVRAVGGGGFNRVKPANKIRKADVPLQRSSPADTEAGDVHSTSVPSKPKRLPQSSSPPGLGQFRPPPLPIPGMSRPPPDVIESPHGLTKVSEVLDEDPGMEKVLNLVRSGLAPWPERAAAISQLQKEGRYTSEKLYELTFMSNERQTQWVVAAGVYESLVSGGLPESLLQQFTENETDVLYEMRTLSSAQRKAAAEFVVEHCLSADGTRELVRAIKDHERRPLGREGFTPAPGDCLAFMLHRAASESRNEEDRQKFVQRGLKVVVSDFARERLQELL